MRERPSISGLCSERCHRHLPMTVRPRPSTSCVSSVRSSDPSSQLLQTKTLCSSPDIAALIADPIACVQGLSRFESLTPSGANAFEQRIGGRHVSHVRIAQDLDRMLQFMTDVSCQLTVAPAGVYFDSQQTRGTGDLYRKHETGPYAVSTTPLFHVHEPVGRINRREECVECGGTFDGLTDCSGDCVALRTHTRHSRRLVDSTASITAAGG